MIKATITLKNGHDVHAYSPTKAEAERIVRFTAKELGKENYSDNLEVKIETNKSTESEANP